MGSPSVSKELQPVTLSNGVTASTPIDDEEDPDVDHETSWDTSPVITQTPNQRTRSAAELPTALDNSITPVSKQVFVICILENVVFFIWY